jgi:hypothetical protein
MASKVRLNKTEQRIIDWMRDGDKALYRNPHNHDRYGYGLSTCFTNLCSRKVVDGLIGKGLIEWFACYPPELRAMLVENNPNHQRSNAYGD